MPHDVCCAVCDAPIAFSAGRCSRCGYPRQTAGAFPTCGHCGCFLSERLAKCTLCGLSQIQGHRGWMACAPCRDRGIRAHTSVVFRRCWHCGRGLACPEDVSALDRLRARASWAAVSAVKVGIGLLLIHLLRRR